MTKGRMAALVLVGTFFSVSGPIVRGQIPDDFSIRVESNEVLVPIYAFYKDRLNVTSEAEERCDDAAQAAFAKLRPDEVYVPADCDETVIRGLTAKDFHIYEDGVEQRIQKATFERHSSAVVRDNIGYHGEDSLTPRGKWSYAEEEGGGGFTTTA